MRMMKIPDGRGAEVTSAAVLAAAMLMSGCTDVTGGARTLAFKIVSARDRHTCGLLSNGAALCWGMNDLGQLGADTAPENCSIMPGGPCSSRALPVQGVWRFTLLSVGGSHTCALTGDGRVSCWGVNAYGQLGRDSATSDRCTIPPGGSFPCDRTPQPVDGSTRFTLITTGGGHSCGLTATQGAYCWGYNWYGQVGDGSDITRFAPTPVVGGLRFTTLSAGSLHTCGITRAGAAYCWGSNEFGQLGNGNWLGMSLEPDSVASSIAFQAIAAGQWHTCGLSTTGEAYCWGFDTDSLRPTAVAGGLKFTAITAGANHTCALTPAGAAYCWGFNWFGQLGTNAILDTCHDGNGNPFPCTRAPVPVAGGMTFRALSAGSDYSCGAASDGQAYCWGQNWFGQLGDGTRTGATRPVRVQP